ncbi:MAG: MBL fold metallo-hydrolase [Bacteroidales bacterium]|nr:MBL fold metallo-hydrolase [Bacteroidales bacterium]
MIQIESLVFNSFQVNTYLVWDETGECLVVDPAFYSDHEITTFDNFLSDRELKLTGQINTHCHVDHVLGVNYIKSRYGFPLRAHQDESDIAANVPLMGDMFGLSVEPIQGIDQYLEDLDTISIGDHSLQTIHVPGHSRGSLAFYSRVGAFVITGDALFQGSIGRTDLPGGDYDQLINSIRTRLLVLPPETAVHAGHGPSSTIVREITENPFLTMTE